MSLGSGLLVAGYLWLRLRSLPPEWLGTARTVGAMAVVAWCVITYQIVKRIELEWLK